MQNQPSWKPISTTFRGSRLDEELRMCSLVVWVLQACIDEEVFAWGV